MAGLLDLLKGTGSSIMGIPKRVGAAYDQGSLFGGGGALGGLLGPEARKQAQDEAIMKMGLSLLGQGPSRTPISFGQSLAQGLGAGQGAYKSSLSGQLADTASLLSLKNASRPDYMTVKAPDGSEVLVDKKTGEVLNPFGDSTYGVTPEAIERVDYNPEGEDVYGAGKVTLKDLAGGTIGGALTDVANVAAELGGTVHDPARTKAKAVLQKVNTPIITALAADLGKSGSKYIVQKAEANVPKDTDGRATFYNKSLALISSLENKKQYANSVLRSASATNTEKTNARKVLSTADDAIKFYSDIVSEFEESMEPKFPGKAGTSRRAAMRKERNSQQNDGQKFDYSNTSSDQMKRDLGID